MEQDLDVKRVKELLHVIPDFPKPGIQFMDIFPVLQDPNATSMIINNLACYAQKHWQVDIVVGLDARGFIFGPMVAQRLGVGFAPVRKKGKLPGECEVESYEKEYGLDEMEMQKGGIKQGQSVLIVDDLLATGGTAAGAERLVQKQGGIVCGFLFVIELEELQGRKRLGAPVYSMLSC